MSWLLRPMRVAQAYAATLRQALITGLLVENWVAEASATTGQPEEVARDILFLELGHELAELQRLNGDHE